jgi:spermidine/putrescine transport system substrate-binding protein
MNQKLRSILSIFAVFAVASCSQKQAGTAPRELRVYTWSSYLRPEVIAEFEQETNSKVKLDYFTSNEELLAKVMASIQAGGRGYDLIFPSDYMVSSMTKLDLIREIDQAKLPVLKDFDPQFLRPAYDPELKRCIPFDWGTTGIAVNTKLAVGLDLSKGLSWKDLLSTTKFSKKVTMLDDSKENLHAALLALGKSWATATAADVEEAFKFLKASKKNLRLFTAETKPVITNDECILCQSYSGDVMQVLQNKPEIQYVVPREGTTIWTDNLAIPKNAQEVDLAYAFMNKILSAEAAKKFTEQTFFASPNAKGMALLELKLKSNSALFPDAATRSKLSYITERTDLLTQIDRLWTELRGE